MRALIWFNESICWIVWLRLTGGNGVSNTCTRLQVRQKWQSHDHPIEVGTVVLIGQDDAPTLSWPIGIVTKVFTGTDNIIRVAEVKTRQRSFKRPVVKLFPLHT